MEVTLFKNVIITYSALILQLSLGFGNAMTQFQQECLKAHNDYRKSHGAPALTYSAKLGEISSNYAQRLANGPFHHSGEKGVGENLYTASSSKRGWTIHGSDAVKAWYAEKKYYPSYDCEPTGKVPSITGHYTQVIWSATRQVGCGVAEKSSKNGKQYFVVCNYYPPGNVKNCYKQNVWPLKK